MAKSKLSDRSIASIKADGRHGDGGGLYLNVKGNSRSWVFVSQRGGKRQEIGLGPYPSISLAGARSSADIARSAFQQGTDPKLLLNPKKASEVPNFKLFAEEIIQARESGLSNPKHKQQWRNTMRDYAFPVLGSKRLDEITTDDVLRCLTPIWHTKSETASRVRGRIETILAAAIAKNFRPRPNPAEWKNNLQPLLGTQRKSQGHFSALPYQDTPMVMEQLSQTEGVAARALEFTILTVTRTNEVLGMQWGEVDLEKELWVIPAMRMKMKREHRVPLSERAMLLLHKMAELRMNDWVFAGQKRDKPLSSMALAMTLRRLELDSKATVHGFRSSFSDWAAEQTSFPSEVREMALAHAVGNRVEAAYRRGDLLDRRIAIMAAWANHCFPTVSGNIV